MNNPFFNSNGEMPKMSAVVGNAQNMMNLFNQQFQQFRNNFPSDFDPKAEVEKAVFSGRIPQDRLNAAIQQARMMGFEIK